MTSEKRTTSQPGEGFEGNLHSTVADVLNQSIVRVQLADDRR